ncbi:MAG: L,D-transpeptidase family protein [Actinomycetota bacterium]|nr:L,D-transpeptidase family protein [Actinomycetota bacterium]
MDVVSVMAAVVLVGCAGPSHQSVVAGTTTSPSPAPPATTTTVAPSVTTTITGSTTSGWPPGPATAAQPAPTTAARAKPGCAPNLAGQLASTGGGSQLITVVAGSIGATSATVTLWQRSGGCWSQAAGPWTGRLGHGGLSTHHREGDGTTPVGLYSTSSAFYGLAPDPGVHGTYHRLVCGDWWDSDPASPQYNTFQHVACGATPPFGGQSEALWTNTVAYQSLAVIEYNAAPVVAGAGSAIFLHDDAGGPTNGCVSLPSPDLNGMLRWLDPGQSPHIAIGTSGDIRQL